MENLLSFLSVKLRQKGMTVNDFCGKIGISRQKFYRFVKEPHRFPRESVRSAISVLSLDETEVGQFESYFGPQQQNGARPESRSAALSAYRVQVENLFRHKLSKELAPDLDSIEYSQAGRHVTIVSPASFARILAGSSNSSSGLSVSSPAPAAQEHEYELMLYNCIPEASVPSDKQVNASAKSIRIIASIVKELEDILIPSSSVRIRIRHCMTQNRIDKMKSSDLSDHESMSFQLRLLDMVLPLFSIAEDYRIEALEDRNNAWTPKGDVCMIKHICRRSQETPAFTKGPSSRGGTVRNEYYILLFSENGECRACRLGSDEVSHIYRYLSPDGIGSFIFAEDPAVIDPSLDFYEKFKDCPVITINPDLYFDNIPHRTWIALYEEIQKRSDRRLYEKAFRNLIDPFGQYAFLSFENLVQDVLKTMEQRTDTAARMGHCVICHPDGLQNLVRTGMITDLAVGPEDCTGSSWSSSPLRFPAPHIRELLEMIRSSIVRRQNSGIDDPQKCSWVNYYILNPQFPVPEIAFHFYGGRGVTPLYTKGRHKNIIANLYDSPAAATILFDYVQNEMIGRRGEKLWSSILSDKHSIALIDELIAVLDQGERI